MSKHILRHPIIFCWPNLEKVTYKYMLLSYLWVTTYPLSWLVSQATSLSRHLAKQGFDNWHKVTTMWKASWGLSHWKTHDNPITSKPHSMLSRRLSFLINKWNPFHLSGKKLDNIHLKDFLKHECELYLKQPLIPSQCKIVVAYRTSNHGLAIETIQRLTNPTPRDNRFCRSCFYNIVENKAY